MQVAQISASAAVSVTDTKIQLFLYESKLNRFQEKYSKSGKGCVIQNAFAALRLMPIDWLNRKFCPNLSKLLRIRAV